jgi:hypothetical protein
MFSWTADRQARIEEGLLEHPDDAVFTMLLSGYAKSRSPKAQDLLRGYLDDNEAWVRRLAAGLRDRCFDDQQGPSADADRPRP